MYQQSGGVERIFIVLVFACLPLNHALALGAFANITMLSAVVWFAMISLRVKHINIKLFIRTAWLPLVMLAIGSLSILMHLIAGRDMVNIQLYLSMKANFFLLVFCFAIVNIIRIDNIEFVLKCIKAGLVVAILFGVLDFLLTNFSGINSDDYIYRYSNSENPGKLYLLIRARSFFSEPGFFSAYIILVAGVISYYDRILKTNSKYIYILSVFGIAVALSNIGFLLASIATAAWLIRSRRIYFTVGILAFIFVLSQISNDEFKFYVDALLNKYTLVDEYSAADRLSKYDDAIDFLGRMSFVDVILGASPGAYIQRYGTGPVNFYILLFIDYGLIAFFLVLIYLGVSIIKAAYPASLVMTLLAINLFFIQDYYFIYIYVCIALFQFGSTHINQLQTRFACVPLGKSAD